MTYFRWYKLSNMHPILCIPLLLSRAEGCSVEDWLAEKQAHEVKQRERQQVSHLMLCRATDTLPTSLSLTMLFILLSAGWSCPCFSNPLQSDTEPAGRKGTTGKKQHSQSLGVSKHQWNANMCTSMNLLLYNYRWHFFPFQKHWTNRNDRSWQKMHSVHRGDI